MSTLRLTTISNQTGSSSVPSDTVINGSAKAWVNFNGTGVTPIRASFNVSSMTDNGTGDYTLNFTTALTDANYSLVNQINWANSAFGATGRASLIVSLTTSSARIRMGYLNTSVALVAEDQDIVCVGIFR
jgi:hypothetical protein